MASVGHVLTEFRKARRLSQLELGLQAEVSARHISFIETGRTRPSREMLLRLSEVLGLAHRDCNLLMTASGYSAAFSDLAMDEEGMRPVLEALNIMLENHNPFPAAVLDSTWNLQMANRSMQRLMGFLLAPERLQQPLNILEVIFDAEGLRHHMTNWDEVAGLLLRRLRLQLQVANRPGLRALFEKLVAMDPPAGWQHPQVPAADGPMLTSDIEVAGQSLSLFSTLSSFGTALDAGLQELMIESYFPADDDTRQFFLKLDQGAGVREQLRGTPLEA